MRRLGLICMLALDRPGPLDLLALRRALAAVAPRSGVTIERRKALPSETALIVGIDRQPFAVHVTPGRMPDREYDEAVRGNLIWPDAADAMARHAGLATVCGTHPPEGQTATVAQAAALTRLAAAVAQATGAVGVYWAGTRRMIPPARLIEGAAELERLEWPADLWLGYRILGGERPGEALHLGAETIGAEAYLGCELRIDEAPVEDMIVPVRRLFAAAAVILAGGGIIEDGMPVETPAGGWRISIEDEGRGPPVARLAPAGAGRRSAG